MIHKAITPTEDETVQRSRRNLLDQWSIIMAPTDPDWHVYAIFIIHCSVETNIRIYSNIRIFSSEYWYSYSIRGHFQNPNIIRIFEYFGPNIQKLFDGKILEFLRNRDKIWTIFCKQVVNSKLLLMRANMCKILFNKSMFSGFVKNLGFWKIYNCANLFEYLNILRYSNNIRIFSW